MSSSTSSNELAATPQAAGKKNGRPQSAESKMKTKAHKEKSKGIMGIFKNKKAKENGVVPVRPSCFNDDFVRRPESPDSPSRGTGVGSATKTSKGKEEQRSYGLWRSKVGLGRGRAVACGMRKICGRYSRRGQQQKSKRGDISD